MLSRATRYEPDLRMALHWKTFGASAPLVSGDSIPKASTWRIVLARHATFTAHNLASPPEPFVTLTKWLCNGKIPLIFPVISNAGIRNLGRAATNASAMEDLAPPGADLPVRGCQFRSRSCSRSPSNRSIVSASEDTA